MDRRWRSARSRALTAGASQRPHRTGMDVTTLPMEERLQLTEFFVEAPAVKTCFVTIRRCDQLSAKTSGLYSVLAAAGIRRMTILKSGTVQPPGGEERHRR